MRRLAVVMVVVFASLNAIDGICCPDGCTHQQPQASSSPQSTDGICALCLGGVNASADEPFLPTTPIAEQVPHGSVTDAVDVPPDPPEHPPRF